MTGGRLVAAAVFAAGSVLFTGTTAGAQEATPTVTLSVARGEIEHGETTQVAGYVSPAAEGAVVSIESTTGDLLNQLSTDSSGAFSGPITPLRNIQVFARVDETVSNAVTVDVRPKVTVRLADVRLFSPASIRGTVSPAPQDGVVEINLLRNGNYWRTRQVEVRSGNFKTRIPITKTGSFRAKAVSYGRDFVPGTAQSSSRSPKTPHLGEGANNDFVRALERRLDHLGYHIEGINRQYDYRTSDAIRAFNKVHGRPRLGNVDAATWRALASPSVPQPRVAGPRFHIEVDQTKQVLYVIRKGRVTDVLHVSTGAGSATRDGVFHVHRKLAGYSGHRLYYPSYFDGLRAIHGWPSVPTYNASHGCVRVPMWSAQWIYGLADIGTEIRIYH